MTLKSYAQESEISIHKSYKFSVEKRVAFVFSLRGVLSHTHKLKVTILQQITEVSDTSTFMVI